MTMRRLHGVARSAALAASLCPLTAYAADLPFEPGGGPIGAEFVAPSGSVAAMQWPLHPKPRRFDIYGNAVGGFLVAVPDPRVVNNGCLKAIEPTYDVDGNLAGYAPIVACR